MRFILATNYGVLNSVVEDKSTGFTNKIADRIAENIANSFLDLGRHLVGFFVQISSEILVVACLWFILGMMIGSEKARNYAGMCGLGAAIMKAVARSVS